MKNAFRICLLCAGISPALWAEPDDAKRRELAEVHAQRQRISGDVKRLEAEKSAQIDQLRKLEKQYGERLNVLNSIKLEIKQQEQVLQSLRAKITDARQDIQQQRRSLEGLVKSAHAMGDKQGVDLFLNQNDPALSGRLLVYYDYISKARIRKLQAIQDSMSSLQKLESQKDTETQLLQVSLDKQQQEADELRKLRSERENLLSQLNRDYTAKQQQLAHLVHDEKKLEALLASFQKTDDNASQLPASEAGTEKNSAAFLQPMQPVQTKTAEPPKKDVRVENDFAQLQGRLPWPVQGSIVERFGSQRFETTWDGTVIGAREGADIHAISSGRVIYADWLRGYGLMMIIDHGKGFMSLYAFNQSLHKNVGESVKAGETLASVGRSGGRSQAALYFGIRKNGKAVDPEKWCRKPGKG